MALKKIWILLIATVTFAQTHPGADNVSVSFSATPTFTATALITNFDMTLTGNVTSSTFVSPAVGSGSFNICQDATGNRTFVYPANFFGFPAITPTASQCTRTVYKYDGTNVFGLSIPAVGSGGSFTPTIWSPEWFGAKRDNVTNDTTALQACINATKTAGGTCKLAAGIYIFTPPLDMSSTYPFGARMEGEGMWNTILNTTDTTHNLIEMHGTGGGNCAFPGLLLNTRLANIELNRTSQGTANGVDIQNGCWIELDQVQSGSSVSTFYLKGTADTRITHSTGGWPSGISSAHNCLEIDSTGGAANASNYFDHLVCPESAGSSNGTALLMHGGSINDFQGIYLNVAQMGTCINISSTSNGAGVSINNSDIHLLHPICDGSPTVITNVFGDGVPTIEIGSGHFSAAGSNITLTNTSGVNIHDSQIIGAGGSGVGVTLTGANSFGNRIHGNTIQITQLDCVLVTGSSFDNQINDNSCTGPSGTGIGTGINFASGAGPNNIAIGNTFFGFITTALNIASGVVGTVAYPNTYDGTNITTKVADAGTGSYVGILPLTLVNAPAAPVVSQQFYCTNCTTAATCTTAGSGHMAVWNGSNWTCQ